jgi:hypothetical protein
VHFQTPTLTVPTPVRVLLVLTNPKDERLLTSQQEIDAINIRLTLPDYDLKILDEPTLVGLQQKLNYFKPHILHYIGHAGISKGEGTLILHDHSNHTYWLCGSHLSGALPSTVRLICLSTCFTAENYNLLGLSRLAHSTASLHLPTMIANQSTPSEEGVRFFWKTFYSELIEHKGNVNEAFYLAQQETAYDAKLPSAEWASFELVLRDGTGKALHIVKEKKPAQPERLAAELSAQVAAQLVNILAEQMRALGDEATQETRELFKSVSEHANLLVNKATGLDTD